MREQSFGHNSKTMPMPHMYSANEFLNPYRYMSGPQASSAISALHHANTTISPSPNAPMDLKTQYPSMPVVCKAVTESSYAVPTTATSVKTETTTSPTSAPLLTNHPHMASYIPKHWIWGRNLFYPPLGNPNYLQYTNGAGSDLSSPRGSNKTESLNSNSPVQITEVNSDDSLDNSDVDKVFFFCTFVFG